MTLNRDEPPPADNALSHWLSLYPNGTYAEQYAAVKVSEALAAPRREMVKGLRAREKEYRFVLGEPGLANELGHIADAIERGDFGK